MSATPWNPDVEVSVHDGELVVKLDHLPEILTHRFEAEVEDGGMRVRCSTLTGLQDHCLHLPLPNGLGVDKVESALNGAALEVHMHLPDL